MKTTVVIPAYKAEKTIARAINSVVKSVGVEVDVIVIEDGVYDSTRSIVESIDGDIKLYTFSENQGAQKARNYGLSLVQTDTVLFLDADDFFRPDFLFEISKTLSESDNAGLALGVMEIVDEKANTITVFKPPLGETSDQVVDRWLRGNYGPNPSGILWKTEAIRRIGGWNEKMSRNQDGELVIRAMVMGEEVTASHQSASIYFQHTGDRVSKTKSLDSFVCQEEIFNIVRQWNRYQTQVNLQTALAEFCLLISISAFDSGWMEEGAIWDLRRKSLGCGAPCFTGAGLKTVIKNQLVAIFGVKKYVYIKNRVWRNGINSYFFG